MARDPYGNYAYSILTANALRTPDKVALTYCGEESLTYDELNRAVNRRAHALAQAGIRPGRRVANLLNETLHVAEAYLAQFKIGAEVAALNPYWPVETLRQVVDHSECTAFVYDVTVEETVDMIRADLPRVTTWIKMEPVNGPEHEPELGAHFDEPLGLFYTSGTTGLPKAVVHTHTSCLATARFGIELPYDEESVLGTGAIIWGIGFPALVGPALYAGMRLVLEQDWGPENFLRVVPRERVTHVSQIPSFYAALLGDDEHLKADLSSLRCIVLGGEPLAPALLEKIKSRLPDAGVYCYYGQTEAPYSCLGRVDDGSQDLRSSGRARRTYAVRVTDPDGRRVVDHAGEINLTGPHLMTRYDGQPERTDEVLRDGWYVGGDLGTVSPDGYLTVLGRRSDSILKRGQWSQPARIEEAAVALPGVKEAGAVGVPENPDGADAVEQEILLAVVPREGATLDPATIAKALGDALPAHQRPDRVIVADELPHFQDASGGPGKLLRGKIRELA